MLAPQTWIFILSSLLLGVNCSRYLGCYIENSISSRLLRDLQQNFPGSLTIDICLDLCTQKGFKYAGVQWKKECFCGNERPSYKSLADEGDCNLPCDGEPAQICGGNFRINVYEVEDSDVNVVAQNYEGCFQDSEDRLLKGARFDTEAQTPELCVGFCYRRGFLISGTQYGKECFCGDSLRENAKAKEEECNSGCGGNKALICGGNWRLSVYSTGIPNLPNDNNYVGCFKDDANNVRVLSGLKLVLKETNTPRKCMNICYANGFKYSGTEYGVECFCGNRDPPAEREAEESDCRSSCPGNKAEFCGGNWRVLVFSTGYRKDMSDNVTPRPKVTRKPAVISTKPAVSIATSTPVKKCEPSKTIKGGKPTCKGQVIFKEDFNGKSIDFEKWSHAIYMPWSPDYEFVVYGAKPQNSFVKDGKLFIKPTLQDNNFVREGSIELSNCTGQQLSEECERRAVTYSILPPIESARIYTQDYFSFQYGIIQIVAKLPIGDWIVPEIWLEPKRKAYGPSYTSGRVRIAMARGNPELFSGEDDLGIRLLEGGILMGVGESIRGRTVRIDKIDGWNKKFHNFTFIWTPENMALMVDGEYEHELVPPEGGKFCELVGFDKEQCQTWKSGSPLAPFDQEFYISLGLTVGGMRDFPDESHSGSTIKPWKNKSVKGMVNFWQARDKWFSTWKGDDSALQIQSIRVISL